MEASRSTSVCMGDFISLRSDEGYMHAQALVLVGSVRPRWPWVVQRALACVALDYTCFSDAACLIDETPELAANIDAQLRWVRWGRLGGRLVVLECAGWLPVVHECLIGPDGAPWRFIV